MFTRKQEAVLRRMRPELAEAIRESFSSKQRMHEAHMDMIPVKGSASDVQSDEQVALREKKKKKGEY